MLARLLGAGGKFKILFELVCGDKPRFCASFQFSIQYGFTLSLTVKPYYVVHTNTPLIPARDPTRVPLSPSQQPASNPRCYKNSAL